MVKTKVAPKKEVVTEAVLDKELSALEATSVKEEAEKILDTRQLNILKRIAYYVGKVGLEVNEACILLGVDPKKFHEEMEIHPIMRRIIDMKELEYKKDLMATLSARGRSGDDKIAQWLLEMKDPDKFGKKKSGGDGGNDFMFEAIQFVQDSNTGGGSSSLVKKTSGHAVIVKKAGEQKMSTTDILNKIHEIAK